jgi:hypothetical protein
MRPGVMMLVNFKIHFSQTSSSAFRVHWEVFLDGSYGSKTVSDDDRSLSLTQSPPTHKSA